MHELSWLLGRQKCHCDLHHIVVVLITELDLGLGGLDFFPELAVTMCGLTSEDLDPASATDF